MAEKKAPKSRQGSIASIEARHQRVRMGAEHRVRLSRQVEKGLLTPERFGEVEQHINQGFADVMKTTLGNGYSQQGLLRAITTEDLVTFSRKISQLQGKYQGGITAEQVINSSLAVDRTRASREIPWSHAFSSRYLGKPPKKGVTLINDKGRQTLVVSFVTAASGKNGDSKHYVNVEFMQFAEITQHLLNAERTNPQAEKDAQRLKKSLLRFDCDCGRHTYWYRYIASIGKFAYVGTNPIGRAETGFPKIRNPQLKGLACKHVLRTMQTILQDNSFHRFLVKAILKQFKAGHAKKDVLTQTTKREMERSIKQMSQNQVAVLSSGEKFLAPKLLERYQQSLLTPTRQAKDKKTMAQKIAVLSKLHGVENLLPLVKK